MTSADHCGQSIPEPPQVTTAPGPAPLRAHARLAPTATCGREARRFVASSLAAWGWHKETCSDLWEDIMLLASELAVNATKHTGLPMDIRLSDWPGEVLRVEVSDSGSGIPQRRVPDPLDENGRGLALVDLLSRRWGVVGSGEGKTVWFDVASASTRERAPAEA